MTQKLFPDTSWRLSLGRVCFVLALCVCLAAGLARLHTPIVPQAQALEQCGCSNPADELTCNKEKQSCLQDKISQKQQESATLANTISLISSQIQLQELAIRRTQLEIATLKRQIASLTNRITGLNESLDQLSLKFVEQVQRDYKRTNLNPLTLLLRAESVDRYLTLRTYDRLAQNQLITVMEEAVTARSEYNDQKTTKEAAQKELAAKERQLVVQQRALDQQKQEQQVLLTQTKNDEEFYQQELARTLAELKAIQGIVTGKGNESAQRDVQAGDHIASIIQGASPCSNGTHLHFEVTKDGSTRDPSAFLKPISATWNNQPDQPFSFGGDWDWPVNNPARISQGYGMTWYARVRRAYGGQPHTGIDMASKTSGDLTVKAVRAGKLYRGSIACGRGQLRYVKVEHAEGGVSTYYLHVNY